MAEERKLGKKTRPRDPDEVYHAIDVHGLGGARLSRYGRINSDPRWRAHFS